MFKKPSVLKPNKIKRRKRNILVAKIVLVVFLIILAVYGIYKLVRIPALTISNVSVRGNSAVDSGIIQANVLQSLQGNYAGIFSEANTFFYPKKQIETTIPFVSSWIKNVSVSRQGLTGLVIDVTERTPVAAWCGISIEASQPCLLLDSTGIAFAPAPDFATSTYIQYYGPLSNPTTAGPSFATTTEFTDMLNLVKTLRANNFVPTKVETTEDNEYTVYLQSGTQLLITDTMPIDDTMSTLQTLLLDKDFAQAQMDGFSNVDYIDLRFGDKVYYKFKK